MGACDGPVTEFPILLSAWSQSPLSSALHEPSRGRALRWASSGSTAYRLATLGYIMAI